MYGRYFFMYLFYGFHVPPFDMQVVCSIITVARKIVPSACGTAKLQVLDALPVPAAGGVITPIQTPPAFWQLC